MNLLLDTNVLIDYLGRKEPFFPAAQKVIIAGFFGDARLWVPAQSAVDAFYVLSRYVDPARLQAAILKALTVISPVDLTGAALERAARLGWDDLEDCLIALAAEKVGADYLITRDTKGFERSSVPAVSPDAWLGIMREDYGIDYGEVRVKQGT